MIEDCYSITAVHCLKGGDGLVADARGQYKADFPGRSARRMTHLGMMVSLCLRELGVSRNVPVVYASAFAESESLEKFIDSFPAASPALFQTSIHPSAVEQALIPTQTAVDRFYPVSSDVNLAGKALENCIVLSEDEAILVGGEERGTWLCEHGMASERSFAFGLRLARGEATGALGRLQLRVDGAAARCPSVDLPTFARALIRRESICLPSDGLGASLQVEWS